MKSIVSAQVTQAHCVCHIGKYREHMRRSLDLEICKKMEIKIDETYHVFTFLHSIVTR